MVEVQMRIEKLATEISEAFLIQRSRITFGIRNASPIEKLILKGLKDYYVG